MGISFKKYTLCLGLFFGATQATGDMLTGDAGAAKNSAMATNINPANAGFVPRTQAEIGLIPQKSDQIQVHYPGLEAINKKSTSYGIPEAMPAYVYKASNRVGFSILGSPGLPVSMPLQLKKIPIVLLDSYDTVDIDAKGKLYGFANLVAGYRLSENFGIGVRFDYLSVGADANLKSSDGNSAIGGMKVKITTMGLTLGMRSSMMSDAVSFGLASRIYDKTSMEMGVDGLLSSKGMANEAGEQGVIMSSVLLGTRVRFGRQATVYLDGEYKRQPAPATGFSFVKLKQGKKDVYPTFAIRGGTELRLNRKLSIIAGGAYQPAEIGPGKNSEDSPSGFGSVEMLQIYALGGDIKPYWQMAGGYKFNLVPFHGKNSKNDKKHAKTDEPEKWRSDEAFAYTISTGVVYRRASLGIDDKGEQPGSYLQTKYLIPLTITARI